MFVTKLSCPGCGAVFNSARPIPEGTKLKCCKCGRPFAALADSQTFLWTPILMGTLILMGLTGALAISFWYDLRPDNREGAEVVADEPANGPPAKPDLVIEEGRKVKEPLAEAGKVEKEDAAEDEPEGQKEPVAPVRREGVQKLGANWVTATAPKALTPQVEKGLKWLAARQRDDGGWDEEEHKGFAARSNVANTCMATLALLRAGSNPGQGPHARHVVRGINFVCGQVEKSGPDSLSVTDVTGTKVHSKIGPHVDTFLAAMLLAEVKGRMATAKSNQRVGSALDVVVAKMQRHQGADGSWTHGGGSWAPILGQALATKGLNRARQAGVVVADKVLAKVIKHSEDNFDARTGKFNVGAAAGVQLYAAAGNLGTLQDSVNTYSVLETELRYAALSASSPAQQKAASAKLAMYQKTSKTHQSAIKAVLRSLENPRFVQGFGNDGGEEYLSYMNLSEVLVVRGGSAWKAWDRAMTDNLCRVQNGDGSWSGHHCITGRPFCTSAALLVLTADRTPVPSSMAASSR
jgi:hypothetical protein